MKEQKEFGETRMFSPEAVQRFHEQANTQASAEGPKRQVWSIRTTLLLLLVIGGTAYLSWHHRAPIRHRVYRIFHHR